MFDPTIYENIKVVLEGEIYDLDLSKKIIVVSRRDLVDLASMSRTFIMGFQLEKDSGSNYAEIELIANTEDLSKEILELESDNKSGCEIKIHLYTKINEPKKQCLEIEENIGQIWDYRPEITQEICFSYHNIKSKKELDYNNHIVLHFDRKIDEGNIEDIHELIDLTVQSLQVIST